jgi:signal transduction histidine kinase/PAS domain-containing protein
MTTNQYDAEMEAIGHCAATISTAGTEVIATLAQRVLGASAAVVLTREEGSRLLVRAVAGEAFLAPLDVIPPGLCRPEGLDRGDTFLLRDLERHHRTGIVKWLADRGVRAVLAAPLGEGSLLCLLEHAPRNWSAEETRILRVLASAGAALEGFASSPPPGEIERLRRYFNEDPGAGVIAAADGTILECNAEFARLFGFESPALALGKSLADLERTPGGFERALQRLQRGGVIDVEPLLVPSGEGEAAMVLATLVGSTDGNNSLAEIRGYLADITHQRVTAQALTGIEQLFRLVEAATRDVLWEWDIEEEVLRWNNGGPRCFRYTIAEMRSTIDWHVQRIHPEDRLRVTGSLHGALEGMNETWSAEYQFLRGDGTYASVLDRAYISRNERGNARRVTGWMLDVSRWREAEDSHRFLSNISSVLESTLDLKEAIRAIATEAVPYMADLCRIDLVDYEGVLVRAVSNPELEEERDLPIRDFIGRVCKANGFDPFSLVLEAQESVLLHAGGGPEPADSTGSRAQGPAGIRSLLMVPILARDRPLGLFTLAIRTPARHFQALDVIRARELARRTALAMENCQLYETARTAVADRDDLLSFVSHDLKNPLNAILSAVTLAKDLKTERRQPGRQWQDTVERAAVQMRQLLDNLVDSASMQGGRFTLHPELRSVVEITEAAISTAQPIADDKGIQLENNLPPDLPLVSVDPRQFLRVLSNLLVNALKFTKSGGTVALNGKASPTEAIVSVSDSGPGMSETELRNVFTKFWQALPGDRRGTGLGLSIAKGIVEAHGGRIWVESVPGTGTTVHVALPLGGGSTN